MNMTRFAALMLALTLAVCLCACGGSGEQATDPTQSNQSATKESTAPVSAEDEGKVTYTVKVVDEGGNPVTGAIVQLCDQNCYPAPVDANGVATWSIVEAEYKASFVSVPAGYEGAEEAYYFEDGSFELTITLKAVA